MVADPLPAKAAPAAAGQLGVCVLVRGIIGQLDFFCAEAVFPFRAQTGAIGVSSKYLLKGAQMGICAELGLGKANGGIAKGGALAKARHIGAQVIDPDSLGAALLLIRVAGAALLEEEHIGLDPLGVEDAGGQTQDGVQVALVHQIAAHLGTDPGFKQHVVGQHHGGAATGLEATIDVLQEGELLVAGLVGEIVAGIAGFAPLAGAKGRVGEDDIDLGQGGTRLSQGIAEVDHPLFIPFHAVQQAVHQGQATGIGHQLDPDKGFLLLETHLLQRQVVIVRLALDVLVGGDEKTGGAGGRILNHFPRLGLEAAHHAVDQGARSEVLAGAGFGFASVFLQQTFIEIPQAILLGAEPVDLVEGLDHLLQMAWLAQPGLGIGIDGGDQGILVFGEIHQHLAIVVEQVEAGAAGKLWPAAMLGQGVGGQNARLFVLVHHLDKEQQHQLGDIVGVVDAVVTQDVAQVPQFLNDIVVAHGCSGDQLWAARRAHRGWLM
ncbi:hypothetical protein D3C80_466490 [compost metagenome]